MSVYSVDHSQRTDSHLRECPVDLLLQVAILLSGERHIMKQHLQALLHVVHAEVVKRGTVTSACELPMLETRSVQHVDNGATFGAELRLEGAVYQHDESVEGLVIQPHHKVVQERGTTAAHVGEKEGAGDGCGVTLGGGGARERRGEDVVGHSQGSPTWRAEYVLAKRLMVDSQQHGRSLSSCWVQEVVSTSH